MNNITLKLLNHLHLGIILLDKDQRILIWNKWMAQYTGQKEGQVLNRCLPDLYPLFKGKIYQNFFEQCLENYQGAFCSSSLHPLFFPPKTGKKARQNLQIEYMSFQKKGYILLQLIDVTHQEEKVSSLHQEIKERKKVEKELKKSKDRLWQITQNMQDMLCHLEPKGTMIYVSPSHSRILGYQREDLIGRSFYRFIHLEDRERVYKRITSLLQEGTSGRLEYRLQHADTSYMWVETTIKVIKEMQGGAILTTREITKRKRMEEALREREEQLDSILDSLDDGVWSKRSQTGKVLFVNKALGKIFGLNEQELMDNPSIWQGTIHPNDSSLLLKMEKILSKEGAYDVEYRIKRPDGHIRWIRDRTRVIKDHKGSRLDGIVMDITSSKEAQRELVVREERFRTLVKTVPDIILQTDVQGRFLWTNDAGIHFFGADYQQHNYYDFFIFPKEMKEAQGKINSLLARDNDMFHLQAFSKNMEDQKRLLEWYGKSLKKEGTIIGVLLVARDISQLRETESSLKASTHLLEGVLNGISDIIAVQLPDYTIERFNEAGYKFLNLSPQEVRGKKCYELLGENTECSHCATKLALTSKKLESIEQYIPSLDIYLNCRSNPLLDEEGNVTLIVEQLRDITPQKRLEEEIRRSEQYLYSIISLIPDLLVTLSLEGEYLEIWAKNWEHLILPKEELLGSKVKDIFPVELSQKYLSFMKKAIDTKELQTFEYSLELKERMEFEVRLMALNKEKVLAIIRDITLRKRRERALEEEMERARQLQESLLPSSLPEIPKGSIAAYHQGASHVSGDYYDFMIKDQNLFLLMVDVTGHGFDASLVTIFVSSFFRRELSKPYPIKSPLTLLNKLHHDFLQQGFTDDYSLEVFVGLCQLETMELHYAVAGAIRSFIMDDEGNIEEIPNNHGSIINNVMEIPLFGVGEVSIKGGQSLLVFTDGVDEPVLTKGTYGKKWVESIAKQMGGLLPVEELLERITGDTIYALGNKIEDDMTMIGLSLHRDLKEKTWFCPRGLAFIHQKTKEIISSLKGLPLDADLVSMALFEALSNAIDHGQGDGDIPIKASWTKSQLVISVSSTPGFDWRGTLKSAKHIHGSSERGRGLSIIRITTHRFAFNEKGDSLTMAWNLPR